jgi:DNA-binding transcriptional ArsR family regulator
MALLHSCKVLLTYFPATPPFDKGIPENTMPMDDALRAVADPTRRGILRLVRDGEIAAGAIATHFPEISRPAVSQHLRVLVDAELVDVRRDGNRRLYRMRPDGLRDLAGFLDEMWADSLARLKVAAEQEEWSKRTRARLRGDTPDKTAGKRARSRRGR